MVEDHRPDRVAYGELNREPAVGRRVEVAFDTDLTPIHACVARPVEERHGMMVGLSGLKTSRFNPAVKSH
jgi:hypothetical protein